MSIDLKKRHFLNFSDLSPQEIYDLLQLAHELKAAKFAGTERQNLKGKNIALIFEKPSTRTRCAFEVAAFDQGANVTYLGPTGSQIGEKESIKDTARVLGRLYDGIEYRGFSQQIVEELAHYAGVPVWNGLTNEYHPTQVLADFMTMQEHSHKSLKEIAFCFLGDGHNNMANTLMLGAAMLGMNFRLAAPSHCQPKPEIIATCMNLAKKSGATITITEDISTAVNRVDFLYTDVWVSMGEPASVWQERIKLLQPYQVNSQVLKLTANPQVKFMHCLPAMHNRETRLGEEIYQQFGVEALEVTEEVFEADCSIVFDQAENRMHTIKALLVATLGN